MEKAKRELEKLENRKEDLTEAFEETKKRFIEFLQDADSLKIKELGTYTVYNDLKKFAVELEEVKTKIRTINYIIGE